MKDKIKIALHGMKMLAERADKIARENINNSVTHAIAVTQAQTYRHCLCIVEAETGVYLNDDETEVVSK